MAYSVAHRSTFRRHLQNRTLTTANSSSQRRISVILTCPPHLARVKKVAVSIQLRSCGTLFLSWCLAILPNSRHMTSMHHSEAVHSTMPLPCSPNRIREVCGRKNNCLTIRFRRVLRAPRRIIDSIYPKIWLLSSMTTVVMNRSTITDEIYATLKHKPMLTLQQWIIGETPPSHSLMRVIMMSNRTKLMINWVRH